MASLLDVHIVEKNFGAKRVLDRAQFSVQAGEIVALAGPSGCGKSTLLRIVAGLERSYTGSVQLDGKRLSGLTDDIGFVFQEPRLFPWLTVAENVAFGLDDADNGQHLDQLLAEVGLAGYAGVLPKRLSGGQAQRVAIARGLFRRPRLLLLDEPFSAVDAFTRMHLQDLLLTLAAEHQITILLVTHDVDEAAYLSNRTLMIGHGTVTDNIVIDSTDLPPRKRDRRSQALAAARNRILESLEAIHAI